jgi:ParB-like chromosome segregation protein Spo0J
MIDTIGEYRVHAVAAMFPLLEGEEYERLVQSIRATGQQEPIVVDGDLLIDGRNRLRACLDIGIAPRFINYQQAVQPDHEGEFPDDPTHWILAQNVYRRHLSDDARAVITAQALEYYSGECEARRRACQFKPGDNRQNPGGKAVAHQKSGEPQKRDAKAEHARSTAGKVSKQAGVSRGKAEAAIKVSKDAELSAQVVSGKKKLSAAVKEIAPNPEKVRSRPIIPIVEAELSPEQQARLVEAAKDSDALWSLKDRWKRSMKSAWNQANKNDRLQFLEWVAQQGQRKCPTYSNPDTVAFRPSNGLQYAGMAIIALEKINRHDTERLQAAARVSRWLHEHIA